MLKGQKHTKETRKKMGDARRGKMKEEVIKC